MMKRRSKSIVQYCLRGLSLVLALLMMAVRANADGGAVVIHQVVGPFVITVFAAPAPLCAGPVDMSVLVQDRDDGRPALDGDVIVRLRGEGGRTLVERATREVAHNKLLYSAKLTLPEAGHWLLEVTVKQEKGTASVLGDVTVAPSNPFLFTYWRSLSLAPAVIALFALNQWLKRRTAYRNGVKQLAAPPVGAENASESIRPKSHQVNR
jgi:hypothetical protein